jgi:hypothetical protein
MGPRPSRYPESNDKGLREDLAQPSLYRPPKPTETHGGGENSISQLADGAPAHFVAGFPSFAEAGAAAGFGLIASAVP